MTKLYKVKWDKNKL